MRLNRSLVVGLSLILMMMMVLSPTGATVVHASSTDWVFPSWAYRTPITLSLTSGSLTQYSVMITTTTFGALKTAGKINSDCSDLRFTNNPGDTLPFYTEVCDATGGTSVIWVQVDTVTSPSTQIFMYYGNPSATSASLTWSGSIIVMMMALTPPTGWSIFTPMIGYIPYGSTTSGTIGGTATPSHTITSSSVTIGAGAYYYGSNYVYYNLYGSTTTHTHSFSGSAGSTTVWPPYMNYTFMYPSTTPYNLPANSIIMNDAIPSGWIQATALTNRFPRGGTYTGIGGGLATHTHTVMGTLSAAGGAVSVDVTFVSGAPVSVAYDGHTHAISIATAAESSLPDWFSVIYIQNSALQPLQSNMILMFRNSLPPLGWTRVTALDNRYPLGSNTFGQTGSGTHTHTFNANSGGPSSTFTGCAGAAGAYCYNQAAYFSTGGHIHSIGGTTDSTKNQPPYYSVIFGQRWASLPTVALGTEQPYPTPYSVMFSTNIGSLGSDSFGTAVTVNGMAETQDQLPYSVTASTVTYTFAQTVPSSTLGKHYVWTDTSGFGQSGLSGIFTPTAAGTITATYKIQYLLTMETSPAGGTVIASPSVAGPPYWHDSGQVTLTAALSGYIFQSWTGSGTGSYSGPNPTATITMSGPITEIANFLSSGGVSVTVTSSPAVGSGFIKVDDVAQSTPYTASWTAGSTHKLEALTSISCGAGCQYVFVQWSDGTTTPVYTSYVMPSTGPASITAIYKTQYQITIGAQLIGAPMLAPLTLLTNVVGSANSRPLLAEKKDSYSNQGTEIET